MQQQQQQENCKERETEPDIMQTIKSIASGWRHHAFCYHKKDSTYNPKIDMAFLIGANTGPIGDL